MTSKKVLQLEEITTLRERFPNAKIVHCHGVFDVLHAGHLAYFQSAKKLGDMLVVTITADEFVNKGPGRPYFNSQIRAAMLEALEIVDFIAVNKHPLAVPMIEALRPHFYVKGPDYKDRTQDVTGGILAEEAAVEKHGGKLVFTEDDTHSSSTLINKFFNQWNEEQEKIIGLIKNLGGFESIEKALEKISQESVLIIGEPIVDTYVFCNPEGISSKSPTVSARFQFEENYAGGALAIANHLADFAKDVTFVTTHGGESYFNDLLQNKLDKRVKLIDQVLPNVPTPRKTRFISVDKAQRIFEITDLRSDQWLHHDPAPFCEKLKKAHHKKNTTIVADFGHGLFEGKVLDVTSKLDGFISLNVQTNSSNFGFNPYNKHQRFSFLSIDTKEVRLAFHDRYTSPLDLARKLRRDLKNQGATLGMTLGPNGSYYFPAETKTGLQECFAPAFADNVVDATGAGDAFFALTSLLVKVGCQDSLVPFLGNIYAGLKTKIIGNKSPVTRGQFIKAVTSILK